MTIVQIIGAILALLCVFGATTTAYAAGRAGAIKRNTGATETASAQKIAQGHLTCISVLVAAAGMMLLVLTNAPGGLILVYAVIVCVPPGLAHGYGLNRTHAAG